MDTFTLTVFENCSIPCHFQYIYDALLSAASPIYFMNKYKRTYTPINIGIVINTAFIILLLLVVIYAVIYYFFQFNRVHSSRNLICDHRSGILCHLAKPQVIFSPAKTFLYLMLRIRTICRNTIRQG